MSSLLEPSGLLDSFLRSPRPRHLIFLRHIFTLFPKKAWLIIRKLTAFIKAVLFIGVRRSMGGQGRPRKQIFPQIVFPTAFHISFIFLLKVRLV